MVNEKNVLTFSDWMLYSNANIMCYNSVISPIDIKSINLEEKYFETYYNSKFYIEDCSLQLRDINQLTYDEKLYIYNIFCNNYEEDKTLLKDTFDNVMEILSYCGTENAVDLADYLREKNVMIEKSDWFKMGKAIKI